MSDLWPWEYLDCNRRSLQVAPSPVEGAAELRTESGHIVAVADSDLPEFVTTLYQAAGLPAPVILERPAATFEGGVNRAGRIEVGRLGGRVTVGLYGMQPEEIKPAEARRLAALIAIRAGEAEDEPDPAEVEELAEIITTTDPRSRGYSPDPEVIARAVLRWFRDKQQRGESRDA